MGSTKLTLYLTTTFFYPSKSKADDKLNVTEKTKVVFEMLENIVGKGENAGYQDLLLFPVFSKCLFFKAVKNQHCQGLKVALPLVSFDS